jgi:hypothetical protein
MTHSSARADGTYDKLFDKFGMTKLKATTFAIRGDGPTNTSLRYPMCGSAHTIDPINNCR